MHNLSDFQADANKTQSTMKQKLIELEHQISQQTNTQNEYTQIIDINVKNLEQLLKRMQLAEFNI